MRTEWKPNIKPPANVCPQQFCFFWQNERAGDHDVTQQGYCGCSVGVCTRLDPVHGDQDWYEPHEPELEHAGLPWFYFIPDAQHLVEDRREEYVQESQALWQHTSALKISTGELIERLNAVYAEPPDEEERAFLRAAHHYLRRAAENDPYE